MSEVFYRKWRPRRLDQVVGQEAVTQTLRHAVTQDRVAHAYMFCGPRGTGKTSTARILAKAVNCLSPQDGEPDNECAICVSINEGRSLDLIEVDAASNRGIDDIRNLRDKVHFSPSEARYKVYIVDEVHMLTEPAFNALLKTLEEPPDHAIFVLATTEAHKVPLTIISRCQRFDFRRIPSAETVARLAQLCQDENVEADAEALALIARRASGSLRDAENLLEQAVVSYGSPLTEEQLRDLLEMGGDERAMELVDHIVNKSVKDGLTLINDAAGEGGDLRQVRRSVMEHLRGVMLLKSGAGPFEDYPEETRARMESLAERTSLEHLVHSLKAFAKADVRRDSSSPLPLELALVESSVEPEVLVSRPEPRPAARAPSQAPRAPAPPVTRPRPATVQAPPPPERSAIADPPATAPAAMPVAPGELPSEPQQRLETLWDGIVKGLRTHKGKRFNLGALLRVCAQREVENGTITLKYSHSSHQERMQEELDDLEAGKVLRDTFSGAMDGTYDIRAIVADGGGGTRQSPSQRSHLVRAAQAMGAQVTGEKEEERDDE